ncbi:uncharacterized protein MCYG_06930 [Microsporum canis CBS 113480]|uniref:60S ribosomal protein L41 n=1 Tax=Arthroderma otae (strain ATCC MYA-4605 / CBS 113480) TaxID=554155 RepID=C5FW27_ARTOC|nr:uncharacterized protein MCYG_06930 [Microsporum canis CBS 113480]EEQ34111.1 hypothetical protein MCYG_06930 [Microsporum canis CBS 113480]
MTWVTSLASQSRLVCLVITHTYKDLYFLSFPSELLLPQPSSSTKKRYVGLCFLSNSTKMRAKWRKKRVRRLKRKRRKTRARSKLFNRSVSAKPPITMTETMIYRPVSVMSSPTGSIYDNRLLKPQPPPNIPFGNAD